MVINALKGGPGPCVSQTVAETSKFTNIWKRFWTPLQIDCGMLVDTGEKDEKGQPILEAKYGFHATARRGLFIQYLKWTPKRLQTVMGHSSVTMTFDPGQSTT